jgi:hypothetical protein
MMSINGRRRSIFLGTAVSVFCLLSAPTLAGTVATTSVDRDGRHDFDFTAGTWKLHILRLAHPLTGSKTWITMEGTKVVRSIWDGDAQLEQVEADGPNGHFESMGLMLYNSKSHEWSVNFANGSQGTLSPAAFGEFRGDRGEFFNSDTYHGRTIAVRYTWSEITPTTHHFEQAFSADGGKSWEPNLKVTLTRAAGLHPNVPALGANIAGQHDFDWQLGRWKIHMRRQQHPLTGASTWTELDGTVIVSPIWGGRADIAEITSQGPSGQLKFLSLRLFDPQAHQWSLNFASDNSGVLSTPMVGQFENGRGDFYDYEPINGRMTWVRFRFDQIKGGSNRDEQAFSVDGTRTWETNWINTSRRIGPVPQRAAE